MDKRKMSKISAVLAVLMVLAIAFLMRSSLRRTAYIELPEDPPETEESADGSVPDGSALVSVTPKTVQTVIATLERPAAYRRTVTVEQFWTGGSGSFETVTAVSGQLARTDRTMPGGRVRHAITDGNETHIWYDSEKRVFSAPAGGISADDEQAIPTYEDVLSLPVKAIAGADYRSYQGVNCIWVETEPDKQGRIDRYWVDVDTGLLAVAEREQEGRLIYRMTALTADLVQPGPKEFTLPDGRTLSP